MRSPFHGDSVSVHSDSMRLRDVFHVKLLSHSGFGGPYLRTASCIWSDACLKLSTNSLYLSGRMLMRESCVNIASLLNGRPSILARTPPDSMRIRLSAFSASPAMRTSSARLRCSGFSDASRARSCRLAKATTLSSIACTTGGKLSPGATYSNAPPSS